MTLPGDLNLARNGLPQVLMEAVASPYRVGDIRDCAALQTELAALDAVLGPDVDVKPVEASNDGLLSDLLRGAVSIPFRGMVRRMTGAEQQQRARAQAVLAGAVRRGFLKGLARAASCAEN